MRSSRHRRRHRRKVPTDLQKNPGKSALSGRLDRITGFSCKSCLLRGASLALEATENLIRIKRIAFHQQLNQTSNRILLGSHDRARSLQLRIDQLVRRFFNLIEQTLAALLVRLAQVNRSQPAHTKLADHSPRY